MIALLCMQEAGEIGQSEFLPPQGNLSDSPDNLAGDSQQAQPQNGGDPLPDVVEPTIPHDRPSTSSQPDPAVAINGLSDEPTEAQILQVNFHTLGQDLLLFIPLRC